MDQSKKLGDKKISIGFSKSKEEKGGIPTPLEVALKDFILALNDSARALVLLLLKKLRIDS
jgi:hypothetical protein